MKIKYQALREIMRKKRETTVTVGDAIGVNASTVSKWQSGRSGCKRDNIIMLCDYLGIRPDEIVEKGKIPLKKRESVEYALMILKAHGWHGTI